MALSNELLLRIYRDMIRQRDLDYQLVKSAKSGKMSPGWHSGLGQDAIVAPVALLRPDDYVTYTHRGCYVWIARGMSMKEILAEFHGKATGCAGGYGGTHIAKPSLGILGRSGMQGGHFPLAVGMGISAQMKGKGQVVMMFFGDGCGTRGHLHEAFNFASIWKLPIIWMCENNGLSMSVKLEKTWAIRQIAKIADNYAVPGKTVDGNDVIAVAEATSEFIERARKGEGPALLEMMTYRWRGHVEGDPMTYRTREEVREWQKKDPVPRFEKALLDRGLLTKEDIVRIHEEADDEVAEAQKFADESPEPNPEEIFSKLYATSHT
ncbi:MAG: thiamine pyrophosphate-dependent dehydrogenase E1 component subunit alpha [Dehalococcoidales bacterium]|nr:thiamine pyrophosphate-dependent dehydrogenase E1 component subunit alpha [Dehalococcoidales bacterium]